MLLSIGLVLLVGMLLGWLASKLHLPRIIGMLAAGILLGPCGMNALDSSLMNISGDLRKIALIIIIAKAGLSLNLADLKRIGRPAILLCFVPATLEILAFVLFAPSILGCTPLQAAILGTVMGAVSSSSRKDSRFHPVTAHMESTCQEMFGNRKSRCFQGIQGLTPAAPEPIIRTPPRDRLPVCRFGIR